MKCDCGMFGPAHYDDCALVRALARGEAVLTYPRGGYDMSADIELSRIREINDRRTACRQHECDPYAEDHWTGCEYFPAKEPRTKTCSNCGEEKPRRDFNRKLSAKDGLQYYCRPCDGGAERPCGGGKVGPTGPRAKTAEPNPKDLIGVTKVPNLSVIPSAAIVHLGRAMQNGSDKYGRMNWREHPVKASIYVDACVRHLMAWNDGEEDAEDSGVHHLGHAMACLGILLDAQEAGNMIDDRVPGPAADLLERFKK